MVFRLSYSDSGTTLHSIVAIKEQETTSYRVPAVDRTIDILEFVVETNSPVSLQQISDSLSIPKASVFRIVRTLSSRGYLVEVTGEKRFVPGPKILILGSRITKEQNLRQISNPHLFALAQDTRHTVQLGVLFGYRILYIDQIRTTSATDILIEPTGTPFEVNISAGGKVLVAFLSDENQADFLDHAVLASTTQYTITSIQEFKRELDLVRSQGYAIDHQEFAIGIRCVAAPIFDSHGACVASVGITGHISKISEDTLPSLIERTKEAALNISKSLGYVGMD